MTKLFTISIVVSGEQGEIMRRDSKMPLPMYHLLANAIDLGNHYQVVADALAVGCITVRGVCDATGVTKAQAKELLKAAGAVVDHRVKRVEQWGLPQ